MGKVNILVLFQSVIINTYLQLLQFWLLLYITCLNSKYVLYILTSGHISKIMTPAHPATINVNALRLNYRWVHIYCTCNFNGFSFIIDWHWIQESCLSKPWEQNLLLDIIRNTYFFSVWKWPFRIPSNNFMLGSTSSLDICLTMFAVTFLIF